MVRHVGDLRLGARRSVTSSWVDDPAAVGHRLQRHHDGAAVRQLEDGLGRRLRHAHLGAILHVADRIGLGDDAAADPVLEDPLVRHAGPDQLGRQPVELGVFLIAHDQPAVAIEHHEALRHVLQRRVELEVLQSELLLALLLLGHVDAQADVPAVRGMAVRDAQPAPVGVLLLVDAVRLPVRRQALGDPRLFTPERRQVLRVALVGCGEQGGAVDAVAQDLGGRGVPPQESGASSSPRHFWSTLG